MKKRDAYARAGVDLARVSKMQGSIAATLGSTLSLRGVGFGKPLMKIGHYAGLIDIGHGEALALHTDGVGTKVLVAMKMKRFDTVGIDCVAMTVNDLICVGSEPVALLDYIALEKEDSRLVSELTKGLLVGARQASASIVGGETAIMANVSGFDLVSMGVGVVKKDSILDGSSIVDGDRVIGIASSGLHSNGYTLARKVLGLEKHAHDSFPELGLTLGEALLIPTTIYVDPVLEILRRFEVHGLAHITGGAFTKLRRLVKGRALRFALPPPPSAPIFELIRKKGRIADKEMYSTFNMGVGFCIVVPAKEAAGVIESCKTRRLDAFEFGRVERGAGVFVNSVRIA